MSEHDFLKQVAEVMHSYFKERGGPLSLRLGARLASLLSLVAMELEAGNPLLPAATDQISADLASVIDHAKRLCEVICFVTGLD